MVSREIVPVSCEMSEEKLLNLLEDEEDEEESTEESDEVDGETISAFKIPKHAPHVLLTR